MKKLFKILGACLLVIFLIVGSVLVYVKVMLPNVGPAPELKIELTPERIDRGKYLANAVAVCMDCHSVRDQTRFSAPLVPGTLGKGGEKFDHTLGFPGTYYSKNITPGGIGEYTDGELYRVITTGVDKNGAALFPVMPYQYYNSMDTEDIYSIIAYVRTLDVIDNSFPPSHSEFPMNFIINTIPTSPHPTQRPSPKDQVAYGKYLMNVAACVECHTKTDKGQIISEMAFAGGREFPLQGGGMLRSSNITFDAQTGIGSWREEDFVQRFKKFADSSFVLPVVTPGEFNTVMPWTMYAQMKTEDLSAIYAYLKTIKPIKNQVEKFTAAH